jgi:hypothetical protein
MWPGRRAAEAGRGHHQRPNYPPYAHQEIPTASKTSMPTTLCPSSESATARRACQRCNVPTHALFLTVTAAELMAVGPLAPLHHRPLVLTNHPSHLVLKSSAAAHAITSPTPVPRSSFPITAARSLCCHRSTSCRQEPV